MLTSPDYAAALPMPSPGRFWQGHQNALPRWIIVHGTAGGTDARATAQWLNTQTEEGATSVHYVIGRDGTVVQLVAEQDSAWGNGVLSAGHETFWEQVAPGHNPNWVTFSIEHVKPATDNSSELTPAQQAASFSLIRSLCERHKIPGRAADATGGITGHFSIDPVNRSRCPGPYPFDALFAYLAARPSDPGSDMSFPLGVPMGWHDDGTTLTAPNGIPVVQGIRSAVLAAGWNPQNLPLGPVEYATPCDPTDAHAGFGSRQFFSSDVWVWVKATNALRRVPGGAAANALAHQPAPAVAPSADTPRKKALQKAVEQAEAELVAADAAAN